ncbi:MAG: tRNA (adenosine(37)-N6)-threonylcarbamoyltransferase complex ATPase subunit type 1 TsaE [Denitrovibrio sp.]|nr:MAG: tRNA (adenosine(37)-N6)-threonylcarbamoyltransferase complex ATPase subunit type 1 TsaE [Denitrovibrio sp.]
MNLKRTLKGTGETENFAKEIAKDLQNRVILMNGDLGAGKTFFTKVVAEYYNCDDTSSPTFTLHQRYEGDITIHHFDLYRLKSEYELDNIGFFEYIDSGDTCFIEWADKFNLKDELEKYTEITITVDNPNDRTITVTSFGD